MTDNKLTRWRRWTLTVVVLAASLGLLLATWDTLSPSTSPLHPAFTSNALPAITRPVRGATLDPALFAGPAAEAYRIAKERPELLERIPCYCGCYLDKGHQNSLDCFHDRHAEAREVCTKIAVRAEELAKRGYSVDDVKAFVDREFSTKPPFE